MKKYTPHLCMPVLLMLTAIAVTGQTPLKPVANNSTVKPSTNTPATNPAAAHGLSGTMATGQAGTAPPLKGNAPTPVFINAPHSISGIIPDHGPRMTAVTISGAHFGQNASAVQLKINNVAAIITGISDNQITATIPDKAGSGPVSITIGGKIATGGFFNYTWAGAVTTLAGGGKGNSDGTGATARFSGLSGMTRDSRGNLYVADRDNHCIRMINNFGEVTTFAGSGRPGFADGQGRAAQFNYPTGVVVDASNNLYVVDAENNRVRKITPSGMVTTLAGTGVKGFNNGPGSTATFSYISVIAVDRSGNVYVSDEQRIRKITPSGMVSTFAGIGSAGSNYIIITSALAVTAAGDLLVGGMNYIRKITPSGMVTILAGNGRQGPADGYGNGAMFYNICGIAVDPSGTIYVTEYGGEYENGAASNRLRRMSPDGDVVTINSPDGRLLGLQLPLGVVADGTNVFVADRQYSSILKIALQ